MMISMKQAAERAGVCYKTIWRMKRDKQIQTRKIRGVYRIDADEFDRALALAGRRG